MNNPENPLERNQPSAQPPPSVQTGQARLPTPFDMGLKLFGILALVLVLQMPLLLVDSMLLKDRQGRRDVSIEEMARHWGQPQTLIGPMLVVPLARVGDGGSAPEPEPSNAAVFLPEDLNVEGKLSPERRQRGIYTATVYSSAIKLTAKFPKLDLQGLAGSKESPCWDRAYLRIMVSDILGVRGGELHGPDGRQLELRGEASTRWDMACLVAPIDGLSQSSEPGIFEIELNLNGTTSLSLVPAGSESRIRLTGAWNDASFVGACLPNRREFGRDRFSGEWQISHFGRAFAPRWTESKREMVPDLSGLRDSAIGVRLVTPLDAYRMVERAVKHGALILTLIFTVFFIFDVRAALRLHTLHYALVGAAVCLFYLALLACSEFLPFGVAYLTAAGASSLMIVLYSLAILREGNRVVLVAAALAAVHAYLFLVLQLEDYALLAGTVGLFLALGAVMWVTRRLHALPGGPAADTTP